MNASCESRTDVLSVDGKEVAKNSLEHSSQITFPVNETFDVGMDTGTSVNEKDYQLPFAFNGKIDKLTFNPRAIAVVGGG